VFSPTFNGERVLDDGINSTLPRLSAYSEPHKNYNMSEQISNLLNRIHIVSEATDSIIFVDSKDAFLAAIKELSTYDRMAFDSEGVNLSRTGECTIVTIQGFDGAKKETRIYVIDVHVLGADVVFSKEHPSLRPILENSNLTKVTFDCRTDSDAIFHQYGVSLAGTFDLQIFDQAVRIHNGKLPPQRNSYICNGGIPFLPSMEKVLQRYSIETSIQKSSAPHRQSAEIWKQRPLSSASIEYAGNDVHIIKLLWCKMRSTNVSDILMKRTVQHSRRYESMFRDRCEKVSRYFDKDFIMEEHAIMAENELPPRHPKINETKLSHSMEKWNKAIAALNLKLPNAYNDVMFILQHDDWFTNSGMDEIRRLAAQYPFTSKQQYRISNPPPLAGQDVYEDDYYEDDYEDDYYGYANCS